MQAKRALPSEPEDPFTVERETTGVKWTIDSSFPLPDTIAAGMVHRAPYFTISAPAAEPLIPISDNVVRRPALQWQIHPREHGNLRYTLVDTRLAPSLSAVDDANDAVYAIYHHIGLGASLALNHSEGVLLLREGLSMEDEAVIVASLLGLLWQVRGMRFQYKKLRAFMEEARKKEDKKKDVKKDKKQPFLGKLFGKRGSV